ncbi:hypothetical protein [Mesotoga sp. BH458_6_3_2_1]|nr:hypothetical protein [Mesotoga sp. BH458_6_3_2_1]
MTELGVFGITIRCHPELVSGSGFSPLGRDGEPLTVDLRRLPAKQPHFPG